MDISSKIINGEQIHLFESLQIKKSDIKSIFNNVVAHAFEINEDKDLDIALSVEQMLIPLLYMDMQQDAKLELNHQIDELFEVQKEFLRYLSTGEIIED